jgi:CAAX protease family protein
MPMVAPSETESIRHRASHRNSSGRGYAWTAVLVGSRFPEIICRQFGFDAGLWVSPFSETCILLGLAIVAARLYPVKNLASFVLAIAVLSFSWGVAVPWIESLDVFNSALHHLSWGGQFFLLRAIRTIGALFLILSFIGSGIGPHDLFLRFGNLREPVRLRKFLCFRRPISWLRLGVILLLVFAVILPVYLYSTLHPQIGRAQQLLSTLPWALATSALNAANEEFQFRSVPLGQLRGVVAPGEKFLMVGVLFGVGHYFGQPGGWGGVFMAGFAGWIWAKSMVETRGFAFAFITHFVQDMVILYFLALSATNLSAAWS